jgi:amino acid adenylation domain-containing protein
MKVTPVGDQRVLSVPDMLRAHVDRDPAALSLRCLRFADGWDPVEEIALSRGQLDQRGRAVACRLREEGAGGSRVLLLLPAGPEFVAALLGCLYGGSGAVPCPPPRIVDGAPDSAVARDRFLGISLDADVAAVLTVTGSDPALRETWLTAGGNPAVPWLELGDWTGSAAIADRWSPPRLAGDELALLLYTSGSTGAPKGVMISQRNLAEQITVFRDLAELPAGTNVVTWMPVYHALGAAGTVLMSQYIGGSCVLLTPDDFVAAPVRWLKAISDTPGPVFSCGPNFAYDRCVERITARQRTQLNLSGWHSAFNAAERIQPRTIDQFTRVFGPHGFQPGTWFPGYGQTEVTLGVCGRRSPDPTIVPVDEAELGRGRARVADDPGAAGTVTLVGCGIPHPRVRMLVVDPQTRTELAPGEVGEVWIAGAVVNQGYWQRPAETAQTFAERMADGTGPFLRTGDLAFMHGAELVICGRIKELIIIRGRNIYPQDIEATARKADPVLTSSPSAAFSVDSAEGERLVIMQSVADASLPDDLARLASEIRRVVTSEHEVDVYDVVLVRAADIPMTGSGKIRRAAARQAYRDSVVTPLFTTRRREQARTSAESAGPGSPLRDMLLALPADTRGQVVAVELRRRLAAMLGTDPAEVPGDRPLLASGLESLRTIELRHALNRDFGIGLTLADLLRSSLIELVGVVLRQLVGAGSGAIQWPELVADPAGRHEPFPLTEIQHGYLVGRSTAYELGGTSIHLYSEYDCPELDIGRLRRALDALVARHEMLRAVVSADGFQRILPEAGQVPVAEYDLRGAAEANFAAHVDRVRAELSHQVLPLDAWPMFDIRVTWVSGARARVHVSLDLLVADVASVRLFFLELGDLYTDPETALPPLGVSFRDYVLAVREIDKADAYQRSRSYWLDRADELPPNPQLPVVHTPSRPDQPIRVRRIGRLDAARWQRIRQRAAALGVTPSAVQLAAYATVLGAWSRTAHFSIDVPLFNRHPLHPDINHIIGDFTSVILLEVDLRPDDGLAALAGRIQQRLWDDLDNRYFSGVEVIREITRRRGTDVGMFAGVVFASAREQGRDQGFQHGELGADWLGEPVYAVSQTPQVLLDHQVYEDRGALSYKWDAVEAMFPVGVLDDMIDAYRRLLELLAADEASWRRSGLPLLPGWQTALMAEANDTAAALPDEHLFTGFVAHARRSPDRPAVIAGDQVLSYGELYRQACRTGRRLRELGARPNDLVGVAIGKSAEQVAAVLGVGLSGAAYLPIDPELPAVRQHEILRLAAARLVLTRAADHAGHWPDGTVEVRIDLETATGGPDDDAPLEPAQATTDLAYVLYTSGSTGTPKGVAQSHRAVLNTLADFAQRCALGPDDRALGLSALSFDLSVGDLFGVLRTGGTLVLPTQEQLRDPAAWLDLMAAHRVTMWNSVPALLEMLADHVGDDIDRAGRALAALRLVWLSGDWIPVDLPIRLRELCPSVRVIASGGPTETAIWCVFHEIDGSDAEREAIPYGRPMRNHTVHILNDRVEPCPVWVTGEMYIGGVGLADGYWRDPERTAASFIEHPRTGQRLYRSGDLGRWLPSGEIEILGRNDLQVKIRGHRIELGEIEAALARQPQVRAAAVTTVGQPGRPGHLAAVVVPQRAAIADHATDHDAYDQALGAVLTDPVTRLELKARRLGRRTDLSGPGHPFARSADAGPERVSVRDFAGHQVPLAALGALLEPLCSRTGDVLPRHRYASAGSAYSVQAYLYVQPERVAGLPGGTYYHDPDRHELVAVVPGARVDAEIHVPDNRATFIQSAFSIFLVANRAAIDPLYGRRSRDFCLIEAGLITQLLDDAATANGLGLCQTGFVRDTPELRAALALTDDHELLHAAQGGIPGQRTSAEDVAGDLGGQLRARLAAMLPEYLVPATFLLVDELPRTPRGKLDRRALHRLVREARRDSERSADARASELERAITDIFRAELGVEVGPSDRFLAVGADSVRIVRIHRRLRAQLNRDFPLLVIFEHPTARQLAAHLSGAMAQDASPHL